MTARRMAGAGILLSLLLGQSCGDSVEQATVPWPDLTDAEPEVRAQLEALIAPAKMGEVDGPAYGELGMHFHAYKFWDAAEACYLRAAADDTQQHRWWYLLGRVRHRLGKTAEARHAVESALALAPDQLPALLLLAELQVEQREADPARESYRSALELDPDSAAALFGLGKLALAAGAYDEAVELFESALARAPGATSIHYPLGLAYRGLGQTDRAMAFLRRRGEVPPTVADRNLNEVQSLNLGMVAHQIRGDAYLAQGRLERALTEYREAANTTPDDPRVYVNVGHVLERMGRLDEARVELERALELAPEHASALYNLGAVLARQGRDSEAVERYRAALAADPQLISAYFNMANAQRRLGRFEEARSGYGSVIERNPRHAAARIYEALTLVRLRRYADAVVRLDEAHRLFPDDRRIRHALVRLLAASPVEDVRDVARAEQLAGPLTQGERVPVDHVAALAMIAAERGDFPAAERIQRQALAMLGGKPPETLLRELEENLARYRSGRPCRRPWREDDPVLSPPSLGR